MKVSRQRSIRENSVREARRLGYEVSSELPLLERSTFLRTSDALRRRMLGLYCVLVAILAVPRKEVSEWVLREGLAGELTPKEKRYLEKGSNPNDLRVRVESLWALSWCAGLVEMDFGSPIGDEMASYYPNIAKSESSSAYLKQLRMRDVQEIEQACDVAYCIHWAIRQAALEGTQPGGRLPPACVVERRRALEWMLRDEEWEDITLDT